MTDLAKLLRSAEAAGCEVTMTRRSHWRINTPQGAVFMSSTPGDRRAVLNVRSQLRRAGVAI